jgi:hypothetical protein
VFELYEQYPNLPADQEPNWGLNSADVIFFFIFILWFLFFGSFGSHVTVPPFLTAIRKS